MSVFLVIQTRLGEAGAERRISLDIGILRFTLNDIVIFLLISVYITRRRNPHRP